MNETLPITSQKPTALITGATGFVGSHLARRLVREGWRVHIVSRVDSRWPKAEEFAYVTNHLYDGSTDSVMNCVLRAKPDVVFHLASLVLSQHETKDVNALIESNLLLGNQLLEAMKVNQVTNLVNTGTSWQHYNNDDYNPVCLYAATKQAFEAIQEYYVQAYNIRIITLKLFDTYGPRDNRPKLFNLLKKAAISGAPLNMSAGEQLIDLVYIDDVIDAYIIAAERLLSDNVTQKENYAVSSGCPLPLKNIVKFYLEVTSQRVLINWGARPYRFREVMNSWNSGAKIGGWYPKISLEYGIKLISQI
jgi:nucleoside-diphosphate-sugar epimerase